MPRLDSEDPVVIEKFALEFDPDPSNLDVCSSCYMEVFDGAGTVEHETYAGWPIRVCGYCNAELEEEDDDAD